MLNSGKGFSDVAELLSNLSEKQKALAISASTLTNVQKAEMMVQAGVSSAVSNASLGYTTMASSQATATATTTGLSTAFTGLATSIKAAAMAMITNPITWITAGLVAGGIALYNYYTAFDKSVEKAQESQAAYASTVSELESLKSEAEEYKNTLESLADTYEIKLTGNEDVSELISKLQSVDLSPEDQVQVTQIKAQNAELERQIALREQLAEKQSAQSVDDAIESLKLKRTRDITQDVVNYDEFGNNTGVPYTETDIITAKQNELKALKELKKERQKLLEDDIDDSKQTSRFDALDADIEKYTNSISSSIDELSSLRKSFIDESTGLMKTGLSQEAQDYYNDITNIIDDFNNIDLSPAEKQLNAINSFFDGSTKSNTIKDQLLEAAKSGESATDALHAMGITLSDLGIKGEGKKALFDNYFDDLAESAKEAQDAINSIDGSVEGVKSAFESENQDADWTSMADYLSQANELYKNGKVGTDDFKAAVQFMSPDIINPDANGIKYDADAYVAAYEAAKDKIKRYFDSENPLQSVANFSNDLVNNELATQVGDDLTWSFKTSAEAADKLGLSVDAVEVLMHNLEAYGAEFDEVMWSGEGLERYQSALEGIKTLYESIGDEDSKERLKNIIDQSELDDFENNLENLTPEIVAKLEFEYDLASIEAEIEELQSSIDKTGGSTEEWGALNSKKESYRDKLASQDGMSDAVNDEGYKNSLSAINELTQDLTANYDTLGESGRRAIQQQESAIYDLQSAYLEMFQDGDVTDWESFLGTEDASEIINKLADDTNETVEEVRSKLAEMFNIDEDTIKISLECDSSEIEDTISKLDDNQTITFSATMDDGSIAEIEGYKNENGEIRYTANIGDAEYEVSSITHNLDGTITYTANINGVLTDLTAVQNEDGTITYVVNEVPGEQVETVQDATGTANFELGTSPTTVPDASGVANFSLGNYPTSLPAIKQQVIAEKIGFASGTMHYPAKVFGTAFSLPAHADGQVSLPQDERALVNEMGVESLIRNGKWTLIPGGMHFENLKKGDIILSASQTASLMKYGKASGTGKAYAEGTIGTVLSNAYANGFRLPSAVSSKSTYSISTKKNTNTAANKAKTATDSAAKASESALDAIDNYFDWIAIRLDRLSRNSQLSEDAIERAVGLSNKLSATNTTISKVQAELTANQQAASRYLQEANSTASRLGLSGDLQTKVKNGTIDITKYDDDTRKKIEAYQDYYDKYLDCLDEALELQDKINELAQSRLEQIEDYYDLVNKVHETMQDVNDSALELREAKGYSAVSDAVRNVYQSSIEEAQAIYDTNLKQLNEYQAEFNSLVQKGYIKQGSDAWYEAKASINELTEAVNESATSLIEFQDKLREIEYTKIQQLIDGFERTISKLDAKISLAESRDERVPESDYQKQLDTNNAQIAASYEMREKKLQEQALYAVTSTRYQELADEINDIDKEIYGLLEDNEELKDSIYELRFDPLDEALEKSQALRSEFSDFMNLLNDDAFFDKEGRITDEGLANIALIEQSMYAAKQEIADYRTGLEKLQESFDNNIISEKEFNEKSEEYRKGIRDAIADVTDYSEALTDLYLNQMKTENEYLQKIIDKRKEALRTKKAYYDYDRNIRSQTKDINSLKAQIAALEGVNNATSQAQLKKLKAELADAEEELADTKRDHAIEMQEQGYDSFADELDQILEDTEYEIIHNAEKQQSVIQSMLNNVVNMYESAYGKINSIISSTGWVGSTEFNQNQTELSTQTGASTQVSNATQHQSQVKPSDTATGTVTDPLKNNDSYNQKVETELAKDPNTDNRPVAELILSKTSVTLEEGKSTSVGIKSIRPTDAKNKTLSWASSDPKIATVSNGTIKAVKAGSCQVTASTTDGSGITATVGVTVTKKPDPPKPVQKPSTSNTSGDGIPNVGDKVTFVSGRYYYDSYGQNPAGNQMLGKSVYITKINQKGSKPYHISRTNKLGGQDLGWLNLSQIKGYYTGSPYINRKQLALTDDTKDGKLDLGSEIVITKHGVLRQLDVGDRILNKEQVQKFYDMVTGEGNYTHYFPAMSGIGISQVPEIVNRNDMSQNVTIEQHYDCLLNVEGNVDRDALPELQDLLEKSYKYTSQKIANDYMKIGGKIRR